MCGIIGIKSSDNDVIKKTLNCLHHLEYRGYDSSGIAYLDHDKIKIIKKKGRISDLEEKIDFSCETNLAIAHTRWATNGKANDTNAHPHHMGQVTLVHNGIIENAAILKKELEKKNYHFKSDTDTEVIAALLDDMVNQTHDKMEALKELKTKLVGSYALGILFDNDDALYAVKKDSPLILGLDTNSYFIASDVPAILDYTNKYIVLEDNDIVKIDTTYHIYPEQASRKIHHFTSSYSLDDKDGFAHYMLKEINEQPGIIYHLLSKYLKNDLIDLPDLTIYQQIDIVGCGSAYHTALVAKTLFEEYSDTKVSAYVASEYRYQKNFYSSNSIVIFISQSGETADTLACVRQVKEKGIPSLAIVNTISSSIARECDNVIYLEAGPEIAVATTKAYTAQITILSLLALKISYQKGLITNLDSIKKDIRHIKEVLIHLINDINYIKIAKKIYQRRDIFFIGRLIDYAIALEGSLKLKEISYIHSETYPAGELKHGTISLIEDGSPVISVITYDKIIDKTISNIEEVKARGAYNIVLTNQNITSKAFDYVIQIPKVNAFLNPIITIIPLQLLAYYVARLNGCDIDKPRNLAKSVTVE